MHSRLHVLALLVAISAQQAGGQDSETTELTLHPQTVSDTIALRLLPSDPDLKNGNAAVVMLRMIWEQQPFMQPEAPKMGDLMDLPYDDSRIVDGFRFDNFQTQLKAAAYMRDADWNYPLDEEPWAMILLPDLQGFRIFVGRGMSLWVGQQIAKQDLDAAREGILVQLACARHVARTPFMINRLVAIALAEMALSRAELLIQQLQSPNLYWALAMLPDTLGDNQAALQWESKLVTGSLPSLADGVPPVGDDAWTQIAAEFSDLMIMTMGQTLSPEASAVLRMRMLEVARTELGEYGQFRADDLEKMSPEEIVMRWVLATTARVNNEMEAAFSLPPSTALPRLRKLEDGIAAMLEKTGAPKAPFLEKPTSVYLAFHKFDRRVKLLQTVESVRDYAARHAGALPASLSDLELPAPNDPLTESPFDYSIQEGKAVLRMATIPGIDPAEQRSTAYELSIAGKR